MPYRFDPGRTLRYGGQEMRIGDAERTEVADILSRHFGDGRLDHAEFEERVDAAMHAKTRPELDRLLVDLPRLDAPAAPPPRQRRRSPIQFLLLVFLVAVAASVTLHVVMHTVVLWPLVLLVVFLVLRRRGHRGYRPGGIDRYSR